MKCYECGKRFRLRSRELDVCNECLSLPMAKRSGVAQRCPPSVTGSADARAADEAGTDSSGRSADKAVRLARALEWEAFAEHVKNIVGIEAVRGNQYAEAMYGWFLLGAEVVAREFSDSQPALTAQRERACLPNEKLTDGSGQRPKQPNQP